MGCVGQTDLVAVFALEELPDFIARYLRRVVQRIAVPARVRHRHRHASLSHQKTTHTPVDMPENTTLLNPFSTHNPKVEV